MCKALAELSGADMHGVRVSKMKVKGVTRFDHMTKFLNLDSWILTVLQQPHINVVVQCGDVELNPGPTIEAQLTDLNKNIEDKFERLHNEISGLGFEIRKMATTLELVTESVNSIKEEIRNLREYIKEVEEKQEHLQLDIETNAAGIDQLELKIETLSNSVEKQEQYSRRENLILHGMKEEADESSEKSRLAVVALLNKNVTTKP
ncbi:hypothetical protein RRG08_006492 [Elysia crispata]|uniref:Uncharacterized protein n=1 Tax=Elysia crispata TaxID=231223 RepID=A0AAE1CVY9_9GAST|nr:hypothetical protein RRG08_006492 [Elysia crispata]